MSYKELRPASLRINPDLDELPFAFEAICFPAEWKRTLLEVHAMVHKREREKSSLSITDLNKTIRALVPDLVSINRYAGQMDTQTWLRSSSRSATPEALRLLMYWWAKFTYSAAPPATLAGALSQLTADQLIWETNHLDLADWETSPNGTAKAMHDAQFHVLPDLLATRLSHSGATFELGNQPLNFYRVPISPGDLGAELISWPPIEREIHKRRNFFSFLLTITVQTIPFQPFPVIHIHCGVRRWVSLPTYIPRGRTSVYLRTHVPWISGIHHSDSFQVAPIRWTRSDQGPMLIWDSHLSEILNQLNPQQTFPSPKTLAENPLAGLNISGTPNAAIVYSNSMKTKHSVAPGLMPGDRKPLLEQIAALLAPEFVLTDTLPIISRPTAPKNWFSANDGGENLATRQAMIADVTSHSVGLEIYYQREETKETFLAQIGDLLGLQVPPTLPTTMLSGDLPVIVNAQPLGAIGDGLKLDLQIKNVPYPPRQAVDRRIDDVRQRLTDAERPTVAFIELANADAFEDEDDPKRAIRAGFAHTGRHTQFVDRDSEASLLERSKKALLDGFRQLGIHRYTTSVEGLPHGWNYVGVWLIYRSKQKDPSGIHQYIPVVVLIEGENGNVLATAPGMDGWMPYAEVLLTIGQGKINGYSRPYQVLPFIQQRLEHDILPQGDTLLLCHAQNLRRAWMWLANGRLSIDSLSFGTESPLPITEWPGLRIVRVRSSQQDETPEWYAVKPDDFGFSKGLFQMGERVFASTYGKPMQFKNTSKGSSILERPTDAAWNPGLYELVVSAVQPGDDPADVAAVAHALRNGSIQYDDATALPLPLHLAKLMEEYILVVNAENEEVE